MLKIITIIGARPQFVKATLVSRELKKLNKSHIKEIIIHTGQHYDPNLNAIFFKELELPKPKYNLGVKSKTQGKQVGEMLKKIEPILLKEKPSLVVVYGDTNSTLAGALAAAKLHIPVAHIEAGMRSFDKRMPEEINRLLVDHISQLLFCTSQNAINNLKREGVTPHGNGTNIFKVGDVMLDTLKHYDKLASSQSNILTRLNLQKKRYFLATVHRAENTNDSKKLYTIFDSLNDLAYEGHVIILPLHPRTKKRLKDITLRKCSKNFHIIQPVSYIDMLSLEKNARCIITDSGGVQKEAYYFSIPTLTLRDHTEWIETLEGGFNNLVPIEKSSIKKAFLNNLKTKKNSIRKNIYGHGLAAPQIATIIRDYIKNRIISEPH